jgi:hypothetical protein
MPATMRQVIVSDTKGKGNGLGLTSSEPLDAAAPITGMGSPEVLRDVSILSDVSEELRGVVAHLLPSQTNDRSAAARDLIHAEIVTDEVTERARHRILQEAHAQAQQRLIDEAVVAEEGDSSGWTRRATVGGILFVVLITAILGGPTLSKRSPASSFSPSGDACDQASSLLVNATGSPVSVNGSTEFLAQLPFECPTKSRLSNGRWYALNSDDIFSSMGDCLSVAFVPQNMTSIFTIDIYVLDRIAADCSKATCVAQVADTEIVFRRRKNMDFRILVRTQQLTFFIITVTAIACTNNSECDSAEDISELPASFNGTTLHSPNSWSPSPVIESKTFIRSSYYRIMGTGACLFASIQGVRTWMPFIAVYNGRCIGQPLIFENSNAYNPQKFDLSTAWRSKPNIAYIIQIGGINASLFGDFNLNISACDERYLACANATEVDSLNFSYKIPEDRLFAFKNDYIGYSYFDYEVVHHVHFFVVSGTGACFAATRSSNVVLISVLKGENCAEFNVIIQKDQNVSWTTVNSTKYTIIVFTEFRVAGVDIAINEHECPTNDSIETATRITRSQLPFTTTVGGIYDEALLYTYDIDSRLAVCSSLYSYGSLILFWGINGTGSCIFASSTGSEGIAVYSIVGPELQCTIENNLKFVEMANVVTWTSKSNEAYIIVVSCLEFSSTLTVSGSCLPVSTPVVNDTKPCPQGTTIDGFPFTDNVTNWPVNDTSTFGVQGDCLKLDQIPQARVYKAMGTGKCFRILAQSENSYPNFVVALYEGNDCNRLNCITAVIGKNELVWESENLVQYTVVIGPGRGGSKAISFAIEDHLCPTNTDAKNAAIIGDVPYLTTGFVVASNPDSWNVYESSCSQRMAQTESILWWSIKGTGSCCEASVAGYNVFIGLSTQADPANPDTLDCVSFGERLLTWKSSLNVTYFLFAAPDETSASSFPFIIDRTDCIPNDVCNGAVKVVVDSLPVSVNGDTSQSVPDVLLRATVQKCTSNLDLPYGYKGAWYKFSVTKSTCMLISVHLPLGYARPLLFQPLLAIYTGNAAV